MSVYDQKVGLWAGEEHYTAWTNPWAPPLDGNRARLEIAPADGAR